jgi:hypothetical protein
MRVTMTQLRKGGHWIGANDRKTMRGELLTKKFIAGESLVKVLEFAEVRSCPGTYELSDAKVKECWREQSTIVFSGLAHEDGAWVAQEWLVDVAPPPNDTPVGGGRIKPGSRYDVPA